MNPSTVFKGCWNTAGIFVLLKMQRLHPSENIFGFCKFMKAKFETSLPLGSVSCALTVGSNLSLSAIAPGRMCVIGVGRKWYFQKFCFRDKDKCQTGLEKPKELIVYFVANSLTVRVKESDGKSNLYRTSSLDNEKNTLFYSKMRIYRKIETLISYFFSSANGSLTRSCCENTFWPQFHLSQIAIVGEISLIDSIIFLFGNF